MCVCVGVRDNINIVVGINIIYIITTVVDVVRSRLTI